MYGDIRDPDLVGADHRQPLHQVPVAGVAVMAARRPGVARRALALQPHRTHEARHMLMVHQEVFASQEGRDPPIAIGRPLPPRGARWRLCRVVSSPG